MAFRKNNNFYKNFKNRKFVYKRIWWICCNLKKLMKMTAKSAKKKLHCKKFLKKIIKNLFHYKKNLFIKKKKTKIIVNLLTKIVIRKTEKLNLSY